MRQPPQPDARAIARRQLWRDFALYLVISVAVVSALLWPILSDVPIHVVLGWFLFGSFTAFLADLVWKSRRVWRDQVFWCGVVFFLGVNFVLFRRFLWDRAPLSGIEMAVLFGVEAAIFKAFRGWREDSLKSGRTSRPQL